MKDTLINLLETFGYPVFLQGSMNEDATYPESFFTFYNLEVDGEAFYDDEEQCYLWIFDVNFYSSDASLVNTKLLEAIALLKQNGFIATGKGHDVGSDEPSHTGRGMTIKYYELGGNENA